MSGSQPTAAGPLPIPKNYIQQHSLQVKTCSYFLVAKDRLCTMAIKNEVAVKHCVRPTNSCRVGREIIRT
jgi:hypothetical protein